MPVLLKYDIRKLHRFFKFYLGLLLSFEFEKSTCIRHKIKSWLFYCKMFRIFFSSFKHVITIFLPFTSWSYLPGGQHMKIIVIIYFENGV